MRLVPPPLHNTRDLLPSPLALGRCCGACSHRSGDLCRHALARDDWGRLTGVQKQITSPQPWPAVTATGWCGFWSPAAAIAANHSEIPEGST